MKNMTFAMIKPDAVRNRNTGKIYDRILNSGFSIVSAKLLRMTKSQAEGFYDVHSEKPFFGELTEFMSSGPCMVLALKKENAVEEWRKTIGATNPDEAETAVLERILPQVLEKMQFTDQILMKMLKKRLDFSSQIVNL